MVEHGLQLWNLNVCMYSVVVGTGWNGIERHQRADIVSGKGKKGEVYVFTNIIYRERVFTWVCLWLVETRQRKRRQRESKRKINKSEKKRTKDKKEKKYEERESKKQRTK